MTVTTVATKDPARVLATAGEFLAADPVRNNVMLTLLTDRVATGQPGRYWVGLADGRPAGVAFQSPLDFAALVTPMPDDVIFALVAEIAGSVPLPGVNGDVATAARFAGQWTERCKVAATPERGMRLYEVTEVVPLAVPAPGAYRPAGPGDQELTERWLREFGEEVGEVPARGHAADTARRIAAGQVYLWVDQEPTSMALRSDPIAGVSRIQAVYTPPRYRGRGYAAGCVATLSDLVLAEGVRCILYTDLANPTSNSVYRRIGYRALLEGMRYRFG